MGMCGLGSNWLHICTLHQKKNIFTTIQTRWDSSLQGIISRTHICKHCLLEVCRTLHRQTSKPFCIYYSEKMNENFILLSGSTIVGWTCVAVAVEVMACGVVLCEAPAVVAWDVVVCEASVVAWAWAVVLCVVAITREGNHLSLKLSNTIYWSCESMASPGVKESILNI